MFKEEYLNKTALFIFKILLNCTTYFYKYMIICNSSFQCLLTCQWLYAC